MTTTTRTVANVSRSIAAFKAHYTRTAVQLADTPKADQQTIARLIDKLVDIEVGAAAFLAGVRA